MIELLQPEINITPGVHPPKQAPGIGGVAQNCAVIRLKNDTDRENAYEITLRCDRKFWSNTWYKLEAFSAPNGVPEGTAVQTPQYRNNFNEVRVFVPRGCTWDVRVSFLVPELPANRAGKYPFTIHATTSVARPQAGSAARHAEDIPGIAVVRPFHVWKGYVDPAEAPAKFWFWRRGAPFQAVVRNGGNDWLYCDLRASQQDKDLKIVVPSNRIAVPPPEPGDDFTERIIPVYARTRRRNLRGEPTLQALGISLTKVEAPSIPPLSQDAQIGIGNLNLDDAVLSRPGPAGDMDNQGALVYRPPIPTTLAGLTGALVQNVKGLVMFAIGLCILIPILYIGYEQFARRMAVEPLTSATIIPGQTITLKGAALLGADVKLRYKDSESANLVVTKPKVDADRPTDVRMLVEIPKDLKIGNKSDWNNDEAFLSVRRPAFLGLDALIPGHKDIKVWIGEHRDAPKAWAPKPAPFANRPVLPGGSASIYGSDLLKDNKRGTLFLSGIPATAEKWTQTEIRFAVPKQGEMTQVTVALSYPPDNALIQVGSLVIDQTAQTEAAPPPSTSPVPPDKKQPDGTPAPQAQKEARMAFHSYKYMLDRQDDEALRAANIEVGKNPREALSWAVLGITENRMAGLMQNQGKQASEYTPLYTRSRQHIDRAIAITGSQKGNAAAVALTAQAMLMDNSQQRDAAEKVYQTAISRSPGLLFPNIMLIWHYVEDLQGVRQNAAAAKQVFDQALQRIPPDKWKHETVRQFMNQQNSTDAFKEVVEYMRSKGVSGQ